MAYKFPYAGAEDRPRMVIKLPPERRAKQKISGVPDKFPPAREDIRPLEIPTMARSLRVILLEVAKEYNAHPNDIVGLGRSINVVEARRHFIWRARHETTSSFPQIGRAINRDHTTAVYHYQYKLALSRCDKSVFQKKSYLREIKSVEDRTELNERQERIRGLLIRGYKNPEIAVEVGVSVSLVKQDRRAIKRLNPLPPGV